MDLDKWIGKVKHGEKLTEDELRVLCEHVKSMLTQESHVCKVPSPVTVCGFHDLKKLLKTEGRVPLHTNYIFMGDFVDHGYNLEVFTTLLLLKARYPEKITLLRGNIESRQPTQVEENDNARKYCTAVLGSFTPSPNIDGIVVCVGGSDVRTIDQMPILCPLTDTPIREPHLVDNRWQSRYMTEFTELEYIDSGSYGHVCKARNNLDEKEYAIKKIVLKTMLDDVDDQEPMPFLFAKRELTAMSQMNHPNVIRYYQAWIEPLLAKTEFTAKDEQIVFDLKNKKTRSSPCLYMQLQYCKRPLKDFLTDDYTTSEARVRVWRQIVDGLSHIHSRNYIHCDLSRNNILMDDENNAIIADFGLARRFEEQCIRLKPSGVSEFWTPPEILAGKENIGVKADIYSLGFIAYELFCLRPIFGTQWIEAVKKLRKRELPKEDWMSSFERMTLVRMLSPDPDDRPSLEECLELQNSVASYVITVPKQQWEFPLLPWVKFVMADTEEDIGELVRSILH